MDPEHAGKGMRQMFPFSAVVGNRNAKLAIECVLSSDDLHSLLICGPKGTGKSVIAGSAMCVCGDRESVNIPLNATEDQLFGGMDLETTINSGKKRLNRSILSRADGNVVFIENVNLLPPYLLYQVMNAAENRTNLVEREGMSEEYDCNFTLIATMDPEAGGLSEHLLDRFDLCVFTSNMDAEEDRELVARRCMEFERDPEGFRSQFVEDDLRARDAIANALPKTRYVRIPEGYYEAVSQICNELNVSGHRGDVAVMDTAKAIAALDGRDTATLDDLKEAVAISLEHRRNDETQEQQQKEQEEPPEEEPPEDQQDDQPPEEEEEEPPDDNDDSDEQPPDVDLPPPPDDAKEEVYEIGESFRVVDYIPKDNRESKKARSGRHTMSESEDRRGKCIGYCIPKGKVTDIALTASIRSSAPYQVLRDHSELAVVLTKDDLKEKVRERKNGNDILFVVDGSGSIGAQRRMVAVKGAILSMLKDAYQKRDLIGMAVFRMDRAEEILPLTKSILRAYNVLEEIPTGGRTPLTHGLLKGYEILKTRSDRNSKPVMVILSDGRCNVAYTPDRKPVEEMLSTAEALSETDIQFIVIDTERGRMNFGLSLDLCRALKGTYLKLEDLNADYIEKSVRKIIRDS